LKRWHLEAAVLFALGWFTLLTFTLLEGNLASPMSNQKASAFDFLVTGSFLPIAILAAILVGFTILAELRHEDTTPVRG
jgi:polyferredoxin